MFTWYPQLTMSFYMPQVTVVSAAIEHNRTCSSTQQCFVSATNISALWTALATILEMQCIHKHWQSINTAFDPCSIACINTVSDPFSITWIA